jgi:hypothetical protein
MQTNQKPGRLQKVPVDRTEVAGRRNRPPESQPGRIEPVHKGIDNPNRRLRRHMVLDRRRQQRGLTAIPAPNMAHENGRTVADATFLI